MTGRPAQLSSRTLEEITRELLVNGSDLDPDPDSHEEIVSRVLAQKGKLSELLQSEIVALNRAHIAWRGPGAAAALLALMFFTVLVVWVIPLSGRIFDDQRAGGYASALGALGVGTILTGFRCIQLRRRVRLADAELREALLAPLRATIRLLINELESPERRWSKTLLTAEAPALVELNMQDTISSRSYQRLQTFIVGHESSAIGLAGPRGSGKTTLMSKLKLDESFDCHFAKVSTPVDYTPIEFARLIHGELARAGLKAAEAGLIRHRLGAPLLRLVMPLVKAFAAALALLIGLMLWLYEKDRPRPKVLEMSWLQITVVVTIALLAGLVANRLWTQFHNRAKLMRTAQTPQELCRQQLEFLRWTATVDASSSTVLKVGRSGFEGVNQLSRAERELTHADAVQALKQFIESLVARAGKPVVICVDELDKLADPKDAVNAINGIKDLFHIPNGHFVLSVSTDAMHSFAARGVPVRDVFDSAFDAIIPVSPLTFEESRTLISRRARNFSAAMILFCHAWSGGHARDLIRTARSCVEFRRELKDPAEATVATLARLVLHSDLCEVVEATTEKLRGDSTPAAVPMLTQLLMFQESIEAEGVVLHEVIEAALDAEALPAPTHVFSSEAQQLAAALAPYAQLAGLCERLFSIPQEPAEWQDEAMLNAVAALADARSALGRHPQEIQRKLHRAIDACAVVGS